MSGRHEKERRRQAREQADGQAAAAVRRRSTTRSVGGVVVALAAAAALLIVGTSSKSTGRDSGPSLTARLAKLKGVPVVVNMWASRCPNCRAEFGYFQSLSKAYDGKVAFLGLDSNDNRGDAESFLKQFPIPYQSIKDPGDDQARPVGAGLGWPTTIFYDAKGKRRFVRQGGYTTQRSLNADIRPYALS